MFRKHINTLAAACLAAATAFSMFSCDDKDDSVSAVMSGSAEILRGDTADIRVDIKGTPPFALRYSDGTKEYNVLDIESSPYILRVVPNETVEYRAVSVATFDRNVGPATGTAKIDVLPVQYVTDQRFTADASCFIHIANGLGRAMEMDLSNNGQWTRVVWFEFDLSNINTLEDYNRYTLSFWMSKANANAVGKNGVFEVKGTTGNIDTGWDWNSQPGDADLMTLFNSGSFSVGATSDRKEFRGDITELVKKALDNGHDKIILRVNESTANASLYYIAGTTFSDEALRPAIEVNLRREL